MSLEYLLSKIKIFLNNKKTSKTIDKSSATVIWWLNLSVKDMETYINIKNTVRTSGLYDYVTAATKEHPLSSDILIFLFILKFKLDLVKKIEYNKFKPEVNP